MNKKYTKYFGMILTSAILMFAVMYLNTYEADHVYFSLTRLYMTILATCVMAIVMLIFMSDMLKNKRINIIIVTASILIFATSFVMMRNQIFVSDVVYMEQMIPHHSIAILTSENAKIVDPRVRKLADNIIEAQKKEIEEMRGLIIELKARKKVN